MTISDSQKRSSQTSWIYTLIGFLLLLVIVAAIYFVFRAVLDFLTAAAPQLGSAVIGTAGLIFVAVIANIGAKYLERGQQVQQEQRARKAEIYEEFMAFWFKLLTEDEKEDEVEVPESQKEIESYVRGFTHKLVAWGSEPFLKEYGAFKENIKHNTDDALLSFEKVLLEIRTDLGYSNKGLQSGDLLKVFLEERGVEALVASNGVEHSSSTNSSEDDPHST